MIDFFAGLLALGFGFGLACWICGKMLDRSNNLGDSHGDSKEYNVAAIFTHSCDNVSNSDGLAFFDLYAYKKEISDANDKARVRRMTDEERKNNRKAPRGAFVSRNTDGYTAGKDEEPDWVKRADRGQW